MDSNNDQYVDVENPATLEAVGTVQVYVGSDVDRFVASARSAQIQWAKTVPTRHLYLRSIAETINANAEELARLLTLEQGKPIAQARQETKTAANAFDYYSTLVVEQEELKNDGVNRVVRDRYPFGVVGLIVAWNFPLGVLAWKLASALMAGNAVIAKPAPTTPLIALKLQYLVNQVLPEGLFTVLPGGGDLGEAIVSHHSIEKVSFTGSTATGRKIMAGASGRVKRLTLELGGNDPAVILPGADVGEVSELIATAAFRNAGQVCIAPKRIYIHADSYDDAVDGFRAFLDRQIVGDGCMEETGIGPVNNRQQYGFIHSMASAVFDEGGVLHESSNGLPNLPGYFINPAIVTGLTQNSRLVQEEQFGPLLPLIPYRKLDEVIEMANDSDYGLGSSVWGPDVETALKVSGRIRSGTRWINSHGPTQIDVPFGGVNQSGLGVELGREGLEAFTEARVTSVRT